MTKIFAVESDATCSKTDTVGHPKISKQCYLKIIKKTIKNKISKHATKITKTAYKNKFTSSKWCSNSC